MHVCLFVHEYIYIYVRCYSYTFIYICKYALENAHTHTLIYIYIYMARIANYDGSSLFKCHPRDAQNRHPKYLHFPKMQKPYNIYLSQYAEVYL